MLEGKGVVVMLEGRGCGVVEGGGMAVMKLS